MQLVAYGAQDIYLTGNPMITYFKVVYRRHTNFAMESIQQTFSGNATFGSRVTCLISRNGDLVSGITLEATLPTLADGLNNPAWVDDVGHHLIQQVDVLNMAIVKHKIMDIVIMNFAGFIDDAVAGPVQPRLHET